MKKLGAIILVLLFTCTACSENDINKSISAIAQTTSSAVVSGEPLWAQGKQSEGSLFQGLNLDGVGDSDDEAYVSIYQFGDFEDKVTVLRIYLGTGETMAKILPVYGHYTFQTGTLFSVDKEAIVLEVQVPGSNYGAANIFVFDIFPVGTDPVPSVAVRLDTTSGPIVLSTGIEVSGLGAITDGTKIVKLKGEALQGLEIYSAGQKSQWRERHKTVHWTDNGWLLVQQ